MAYFLGSKLLSLPPSQGSYIPWFVMADAFYAMMHDLDKINDEKIAIHEDDFLLMQLHIKNILRAKGGEDVAKHAIQYLKQYDLTPLQQAHIRFIEGLRASLVNPHKAISIYLDVLGMEGTTPEMMAQVYHFMGVAYFKNSEWDQGVACIMHDATYHPESKDPPHDPWRRLTLGALAYAYKMLGDDHREILYRERLQSYDAAPHDKRYHGSFLCDSHLHFDPHWHHLYGPGVYANPQRPLLSYALYTHDPSGTMRPN